VPAVYELHAADGLPLYSIPDGEGGWMYTSLDTQLRFFDGANTWSGGKVARTVQIVKW
jgi:hypothetical protein